MDRESVLFPATWNKWPILEHVQGQMSGWELPPPNRDLPGDGPFNLDPDVYDFENGTTLPKNLVYWRVPWEGAFSTTARGLEIVPSRANLTGVLTLNALVKLNGQRGLSFIARRQTHTLFTFTADLTFKHKIEDQEAGVTLFVTQVSHIDIGLVLLSSNSTNQELSFRFRAIGRGAIPEPTVVPVPASWADGPIRLQTDTSGQRDELRAFRYARFPSKLTDNHRNSFWVFGERWARARLYVGSVVDCPDRGNAYFVRWRYTGAA